MRANSVGGNLERGIMDRSEGGDFGVGWRCQGGEDGLVVDVG